MNQAATTSAPGWQHLAVIGWLYVAFGACAFVEWTVDWFMPIPEKTFSMFLLHPRINLILLLLPLGAGLLARRAWALRGTRLLWKVGGVMFIVLLTFLLLPATCGWTGATWSSFSLSTQTMDGKGWTKSLIYILVVLPLFVAHLRVLYSRETRELLA